MKALTLWQPWASLVAIGAKRMETRSWWPHVLQPGDLLAIHAAQRPITERMVIHDLWDYAGGVMLATIQQAGYDRFEELPLGAVLGVCIYRGASRTEDVVSRPGWDESDERLFGDFTPGRWAWDLDLILRCDPIVPARGRQLLWEWEPPEDLLDLLARHDNTPAEAGEESAT